MCFGVPMQVVEPGNGFALCRSEDQLRRIDTMLVGKQPAGTRLLTFLDTAREMLTPQRAAQNANALQAVDLAMKGYGGIDHLFQDLITEATFADAANAVRVDAEHFPEDLPEATTLEGCLEQPISRRELLRGHFQRGS